MPTANDAWNSRFSTGPAVCDSVFHLPEDLRLADDERLEAGGDAEEMPRGFEVGGVIQMRRDVGPRHVIEHADELHQVATRPDDVVARDVQFGAVARRDDRRLARRAARRERRERVRDAARLKVHALAQFDRRGSMAESHQQQSHQLFALTPDRVQKLWLVVRK